MTDIAFQRALKSKIELYVKNHMEHRPTAVIKNEGLLPLKTGNYVETERKLDSWSKLNIRIKAPETWMPSTRAI